MLIFTTGFVDQYGYFREACRAGSPERNAAMAGLMI